MPMGQEGLTSAVPPKARPDAVPPRTLYTILPEPLYRLIEERPEPHFPSSFFGLLIGFSVGFSRVLVLLLCFLFNML